MLQRHGGVPGVADMQAEVEGNMAKKESVGFSKTKQKVSPNSLM